MKLVAAFSAVMMSMVASWSVVSGQDNENVIILVHGLGGWGEDEFFGFPYWSYKDELENAGLIPYVAKMGKFTSNFDRAVELFAQIKGLKTDYGACHSAKFGHLRDGPDYTGAGLYPAWDGTHKVHLMGHSMGGPTMRTLEHLLRQGSGCAQDTFPLFTGGKAWIKSISSISGVLDGTSFVEQMGDGIVAFLKDFVVAIAGLTDSTLIEDVYDIDFSQWGVKRKSGESFDKYWDRVVASGALKSKDISVYDLSLAGAKEANANMMQTYPDTYYFSFATERTNFKRSCFLFWCVDSEVPDPLMIIFLHLTASLIGDSDNVPEYRKNDGLVNWYNQLCATNATVGHERCIPYTGTWSPGKWHYYDVNTLDHLQVILRNTLTDIFNYNAGPKKIYREHAKRLMALPKGVTGASIVAAETSANDAQFEAIQYLAIADENSTGIEGKTGAVIGLFVALAVIIAIAALFSVRYYRKKHSKASASASRTVTEERTAMEIDVESNVKSDDLMDEKRPKSKKRSDIDLIESLRLELDEHEVKMSPEAPEVKVMVEGVSL